MIVRIKPKALKVIDAVADSVESINTTGSGFRYALRFKRAIEKLAIPGIQYSICNHEVLAALMYSCSNFNDWVIIFKIEKNALVVYNIIHGSLLY